MSDDGPDLTPLGSWFGPIPAWRFASFLVIGVAVHVVLAWLVEGAGLQPWLVLGVVALGALMGVPLGRQDARGVLRPRVDHRGKLVWPGVVVFVVLSAVVVVTISLGDDAPLFFPLAMAGAGAAGVTGVRSRDRAVAAGRDADRLRR